MATLPPSTYTGPVNNSINGTAQGDALVSANQAQAAALGVTIPGVANPAQPPAPQPPAPTSTTPSNDYYSRYTPAEQSANDYINTPVVAKTADQIAQEKTTAAQSQIDAINRQYDSYLAEQNVVNQGRDRGTNSLSVLSGLSGSSDALNAANTTTALNAKDNEKIQAERGTAIQGILSKIRSDAVTEAQQSRTEARLSAEDILKNRSDMQTEAYTHLTNLSKGGVTADGLKASDPAAYAHLVKQVGSEDEVKALFTLNRPQDQILDKSVQNGKYVIAYQNPLTGKVRIESTDLGIPPGYTKSFDLGDHLAFAPDNWNGDPKTLLTIPKGLPPKEVTTTDAFGNQHISLVGGKYGSQSTEPSPSSTPTADTTPKAPLDFKQYGLLSKTDFNPSNMVDGLAQKYLDTYIKNGTVPTASSLGRNMKPAAMAQVDQRARDLYFKATGTALPNPEIIKGYQKIVNSNNEFVNNLKTQEGTVKANFGLSLENLKASDLNTNGSNALNNFLDNVKQYWLGNPEAAQYALQNSTVTNEIGSLLAVRNSSGTTVHDKLVSAGLIPKGASQDQQKAMLQTLLTEANNAKGALGSATADIYKQIDPLVQDPNNPLRDSQINAQTTPMTSRANSDGTVAVTDPSGGVHAFPDTKSAIAFKNAVNSSQ